MHRFSSRLEWHEKTSALARENEIHGGSSLDLTVSNPTNVGLNFPAGVLDALANPAGMTYQPDPLGLVRARQAISEYYRGQVRPDQIVLTASTSEAYSWLFKLLCDPGDAVLVPRPSYPLFDF